MPLEEQKKNPPHAVYDNTQIIDLIYGETPPQDTIPQNTTSRDENNIAPQTHEIILQGPVYPLENGNQIPDTHYLQNGETHFHPQLKTKFRMTQLSINLHKKLLLLRQKIHNHHISKEI